MSELKRLLNLNNKLSNFINGPTLGTFKKDNEIEYAKAREIIEEIIGLAEINLSKKRIEVTPNKFTDISFNANEFQLIKELQNTLKMKNNQYVEDIIVHGSYGNGETNNYSDLDIICVLNSDSFNSEGSLIKTKKFIMKNIIPVLIKVDPFQHHGVFIFYPHLMNNYISYYLPTTVIEHSLSLNGYTYNINVVEDTIQYKDSYYITMSNLFKLFKKAKYTRDIYLYKRFLSNLMMVPSFYLQAKGSPIFKKYSFREFRRLVSDDCYSVIEKASEIRNHWPKYSMYKFLSKILLKSGVFSNNPLVIPRLLGIISRIDFINNIAIKHKIPYLESRLRFLIKELKEK